MKAADMMWLLRALRDVIRELFKKTFFIKETRT